MNGTVIGLASGVALGFAGAFGGVVALLIVLVLGPGSRPAHPVAGGCERPGLSTAAARLCDGECTPRHSTAPPYRLLFINCFV
jgi:hypothetical protein